MRMPNKSILDSLYGDPHIRWNRMPTTCFTSRYQYILYRDVQFPLHDVIQRRDLRTNSVDQVSLDRPKCYRF